MKIATAQFSESKGEYFVACPDGEIRKFVRLDDAAVLCDKHKWELHYKGMIA